jgi:hypothetical protein
MSDTNTIIDELSNPPTFHLPADFFSNRSRYELWGVRVPVKLDVSVLADVGFHLVPQYSSLPHHAVQAKTNPSETESRPTAAHVIAKFPVKEHTHGLVSANPIEFDTYRILVRDEQSIKEMKAISQPFDKLVNIIDLSPTEISEADIAPSKDKGQPMNDEKQQLRIPYKSVEQVLGLKRRWNIYGTTSLDEQTLWKKRQENEKNHSPKHKKSRKHAVSTESSPKKQKTGHVDEAADISPKKDKKSKKDKTKK